MVESRIQTIVNIELIDCGSRRGHIVAGAGEEVLNIAEGETTTPARTNVVGVCVLVQDAVEAGGAFKSNRDFRANDRMHQRQTKSRLVSRQGLAHAVYLDVGGTVGQRVGHGRQLFKQVANVAVPGVVRTKRFGRLQKRLPAAAAPVRDVAVRQRRSECIDKAGDILLTVQPARRRGPDAGRIAPGCRVR